MVTTCIILEVMIRLLDNPGCYIIGVNSYGVLGQEEPPDKDSGQNEVDGNQDLIGVVDPINLT
mgnify:FL=1